MVDIVPHQGILISQGIAILPAGAWAKCPRHGPGVRIRLERDKPIVCDECGSLIELNTDQI